MEEQYELFRTAKGIIERYGDDAAAYAEEMAQGFAARGRKNGAAYWRRVGMAIRQYHPSLAEPPKRFEAKFPYGFNFASTFTWIDLAFDGVRIWFVIVVIALALAYHFGPWENPPLLGIGVTLMAVGTVATWVGCQYFERRQIRKQVEQKRRLDVMRTRARKSRQEELSPDRYAGP